MIELPLPMTTVDNDIEGYDGFLLNVQKLMASELWALSTGDEFKAAVGLWCRAWTQKPHGSLPSDNRVLAGFSGAGAKWNRVKDMALRGFIKCSDGRLYHETLCEDVLRASEAKSARLKRTEAATQARQKQRNSERNVERDVEQKDNVTTTNITLTLNEDKKEDGLRRGREAIQNYDGLRDQLVQAAGWQTKRASGGLEVIGPIIALMASGADLELDVLPIIRRDAPRCNGPNWKYFTNAIAQARDARIRASTIVSPERPVHEHTRTSRKGNLELVHEAIYGRDGQGDPSVG